MTVHLTTDVMRNLGESFAQDDVLNEIFSRSDKLVTGIPLVSLSWSSEHQLSSRLNAHLERGGSIIAPEFGIKGMKGEPLINVPTRYFRVKYKREDDIFVIMGKSVETLDPTFYKECPDGFFVDKGGWKEWLVPSVGDFEQFTS
jgi:hypothetical protein